MYVRKEAVLSSQIEGTQASLVNVLEYDIKEKRRALPKDVEQVVNYVGAMNLGLELIKERPLDLDLIKQIHSRLMENVRGSQFSTGVFRDSQNWIGPKGCHIREAVFVPPSPVEMEKALIDLETFLREPVGYPPLILSGLVHAQFETIHPFNDGNGRIGRLLITFLLCQRGVLRRPLLYLSYFLKRNQTVYYQSLQRVRDKGDWEAWLKFYLKGVEEVANQATRTTQRILALQEDQRHLLQDSTFSNALRLYEVLFEYPILTIPQVAEVLDVSYPTARSAVSKLCELGILDEDKSTVRPKVFIFRAFLEILEERTDFPDLA
jgi:Fic family protein